MNPEAEVIASANAILLVGAETVMELGAGAVTGASGSSRLLGPTSARASGRAACGEAGGGHKDGADDASGDCGCDASTPAHDVLLTRGDVVTGCDLVPPKLLPHV